MAIQKKAKRSSASPRKSVALTKGDWLGAFSFPDLHLSRLSLTAMDCGARFRRDGSGRRVDRGAGAERAVA
jgi:hypothetical protein